MSWRTRSSLVDPAVTHLLPAAAFPGYRIRNLHTARFGPKRFDAFFHGYQRISRFLHPEVDSVEKINIYYAFLERSKQRRVILAAGCHGCFEFFSAGFDSSSLRNGLHCSEEK